MSEEIQDIIKNLKAFGAEGEDLTAIKEYMEKRVKDWEEGNKKRYGKMSDFEWYHDEAASETCTWGLLVIQYFAMTGRSWFRNHRLPSCNAEISGQTRELRKILEEAKIGV